MQNRTKERKKGAIYGLVIGVGLLGAMIYFQYSMPEMKAHGQTVAYHSHVEVDYFINDERQLVPADVGLKEGHWTGYLDGEGIGGDSPIHTHDLSGTFHIEPRENKQYSIGDLIQVWGVEAESACVYMLGSAVCQPVDMDQPLQEGYRFEIKA